MRTKGRQAFAPAVACDPRSMLAREIVESLGRGSTKFSSLEATFQYVFRYLLPMSMLRM